MKTKLLNQSNIRALAKRKKDSHKGDYGFVSVIGGDLGFGGAVFLAGTAALRMGAGLVQVLTHSEHASSFLAQRPELMSRALFESNCKLAEYLSKTSTIVLGPGLGQSSWSKSVWEAAQCLELPMVLDADGLNLLAGDPSTTLRMTPKNWVLTPHPKEAARLLGQSLLSVQADRPKAILKLQAKYGGVVVLKGFGTLITDGIDLWLCKKGGPGMATAGMGDVLAGVIGALMAQGLSNIEAAKRGVYLHAKAGDAAVKAGGERGLCALDLMPFLRLANQS